MNKGEVYKGMTLEQIEELEMEQLNIEGDDFEFNDIDGALRYKIAYTDQDRKAYWKHYGEVVTDEFWRDYNEWN